MKCTNSLIAVVILFGICRSTLGADVQPKTCVEKNFLDLVTKWRQGDTLPFPLPQLDVISMPTYDGQYSGFGIKVSFQTGEMKLVGVSNFTVEDIVVSTNNTIQTSGSILFPLLTLTADNYNLKGRAYLVYNLKGSGAMHVTFENVKLTFGLVLGPHGAGTQIKDIQLNFSVVRAKMDLANSSWPINKVVNAEALNIINSYHSTMVDTATETVKASLNEYLSTVPPAELLSIFLSGCRYLIHNK